MTVVAHIDRDYIAEPPGDVSRVGLEWTTEELHEDFGESPELDDAPKVRFRMKDDDGEIYYGGWLLNDPHCIVQSNLLRWGGYDAGCTTIEIKVDDEWKQEIG